MDTNSSIGRIAFLTILFIFPVSSLAKTDLLCAPLRAFVESVKPDQAQIFEFRTSWGSDFKDSDSTKSVIFAKRCNHFDYGPAKPVCAYLMEHGAIEFSDNNLKRIIMCLSPKTRFDSDLSVSSAVMSLTYGSDDRGALVSLDFAEDSQVGGMVLRVKADGY
jgi:hypothetical protein